MQKAHCLFAYGSIGSRENIGGATAAVAEELMGKSTALAESSGVNGYLLHTTCRENNCSSISYAQRCQRKTSWE